MIDSINPDRKNLYPIEWLKISQEARMALAKEFNIPRSGAADVIDNIVYSDGYTAEDLMHLTMEKMQKFTESDSESFIALLELSINKLLKINVKEKKSSEDKGTDSTGDEKTTGSDEVQTESKERIVPTPIGSKRVGRGRKNDSGSSVNDNKTSSDDKGEGNKS